MTDARLVRFARQYFQLTEPSAISWPPGDLLRLPATQACLFETAFDVKSIKYLPPERYTLRVLKRLLRLIEDAVQDPEEDDISDDLSCALADLISRKQPSEFAAAQTPAYVTYSLGLEEDKKTITLLESRSIISASGTTGRRTWEAALHLCSYLLGPGRSAVAGKRVLELGAGTGLVSILSAGYLDVQHVTATDGDDGVVEELQKNLFLNNLDGSEKIYAKTLKWGHAFEEDESGRMPSYDVVLAADITYDTSIIPALMSTFCEVAMVNAAVEVIISATIRNLETFETFENACERGGFAVIDVDFPLPQAEEQMGPFYPTSTPIRIVRVRPVVAVRDPFALG